MRKLPPLDFSHGIPVFANFENTIVPIAMLAGLTLVAFAFSRALSNDFYPESSYHTEPPIFTRTRIK